jgi:regulator of cell morphogenesis and NO signaling
MKNFNMNQTIGESVTVHPELVKIYMDYGVDFCCGGNRTVKEAVEKDTDKVDELILDAEKALEEASMVSVDSQNLKLSDLSSEQLVNRILSKHHSYLKKELPVISNLMSKVLMVHGGNHEELFEIHKLFGQLKTDLESHLVKEEVMLFPKLKENDSNSKSLITELEDEHDVAGDALHKLTELTDHFTLPEDG